MLMSVFGIQAEQVQAVIVGGATFCHPRCQNWSLKACGILSTSVYTMRCVSVCVRGEWFRVPCGGPSASVQSLGSDALRRYHQAKEHEDGDRDMEFSMRRCRGGELLHPEDRAEDVLEDDDFVQLGTLLQLVYLNVQITES